MHLRRPGLPLTLTCDHTRIEMVISNLLDNAIKFTPPGGVIEVGGEEFDGVVHIWVEDNGHGIHPEDLPHIFERFYRGQDSHAEGYGLGLSIVQSIVMAHGAKTEVESSPGEGTRFTILWPI